MNNLQGRAAALPYKYHNAAHTDGTGGALWLPSYLRRDATALGLLLLSMLDITSSFL